MVDEDTYEKLVNRRLGQKGFVEDDDGQGYVDNGYDEVDEDDYDDSDEEAKGSKRKKKDQIGKPAKKINQFFKAAVSSSSGKQFSDAVGPSVILPLSSLPLVPNFISTSLLLFFHCYSFVRARPSPRLTPVMTVFSRPCSRISTKIP